MHKILALVALFCTQIALANKDEPWFTGPLLAEPAATIEPGEINLEIFNFNIQSNAVYDNFSQVVLVPPTVTNQIIPQLTVGIAPRLDIELQPALITNYYKNKNNTNLADTTVILGMQALKQHEGSSEPDLRITLTQILPSGHYEALSEQNYALNSTGMGTYQTGLDFNFQKLIPLKGNTYLNAHWSVGYLYSNSVHIKGYSTYGGSALTDGEIKPGSVYTADLAGELSLSQHWVIVLEGFYQYQDADRFFGNYGDLNMTTSKKTKRKIRQALSRLVPNKNNISSLFLEIPKVGNATMDMLSLAPALEYNFSPKFGIIMGSWFSFYGKNTFDFGAFVMGMNILF